MKNKLRNISIGIFAVLVVVCFVAGVFADAPFSNNVTMVSSKLLPARPLRYAVAYATNTAYAQGTVVTNGSRFYMNVTGTNSGGTAPVHYSGDVSDGGITWRCIEQPKLRRQGFSLVNDAGVIIYISLGSPAQTNMGIRLNANGGAFSMDENAFQGAVYGIAASGSNGIAGQEWPQTQ